MNTAGEQTVTVSYTDLAGATVSKTYTITVLPEGAKTISYLLIDDYYDEVPMEDVVDFTQSTLPEYSVAGDSVTIDISLMYGLTITGAFDDFETEYLVSGSTITFTAPDIGSLSGYTITIFVKW